MPTRSEDVEVGHLFDALAALGNPTVFLRDDREQPDERDMPQLLGAIDCTVLKLLGQHEAGDPTGRQWAAGWLGTAAANRGPCGARHAFELVALRLQMTERLLEGYRNPTPVGQLISACMAAVTRYAVAHTLAVNAAAAASGGRTDLAEEYRRLSRDQAQLGRAAVSEAAVIQVGLFDALGRGPFAAGDPE